MIVLCVDTSLKACHIALVQEGEILAEIYQEMTHGHAIHLVPFIEDVLRQAGKSYGDIDAFTVTKGPGSFTGIRVGLATISAMALSLGKPVLGFSTLEVLALPYSDKDRVVKIDTRCGDYFTQYFQAPVSEKTEIGCFKAEEIETLYPDVLQISEEKIDVVAWAKATQMLLSKGGQVESRYDIVPVYVKPPEAKRASYLPDIQWND